MLRGNYKCQCGCKRTHSYSDENHKLYRYGRKVKAKRIKITLNILMEIRKGKTGLGGGKVISTRLLLGLTS